MNEEKKNGSWFRGKRLGWTILAVALILTLAIGGVTGAFARLIDTAGAAEETFKAPVLGCDVTYNGPVTFEGGGVADQYTVTLNSTSNVSGFIRVKVVSNWVDGTGNILASAPEDAEGSLPTPFEYANWTLKDGNVLYYNGVVAPGGSVSFTVSHNENARVTVLAEAIQAEPAQAVQSAWGMSFSGSEWTP